MKDDYIEYHNLCLELKRKVPDGYISGSIPTGHDTCVILGVDSNGNDTEWDLNYYGKKEGYTLAYYAFETVHGEASFNTPQELDDAMAEAMEDVE